MNVRKLKPEDAPFMLEWMHDKSVVEDLKANFAEKSLSDCLNFISQARIENENLHFAIVDDCDTYMGTVSLKHIDQENKVAEFAITVRKSAMGKGYSRYGMAWILRYGTEKLGLERIYWCVSEANNRAVRFYDKNQYRRTSDVPEHLRNCYLHDQGLIWYVYTEPYNAGDEG